MVTRTSNHNFIKDRIKVATNPIAEYLASQGVVVDELSVFNEYFHKADCFIARNPGGDDKGSNAYSITESRLNISIRAIKYYGGVGCSIETNIMEWSRIKHFKCMIQIQDNWSDPDFLPEFICTVLVTKLLDIIYDHLRNKLGIRKIPISYVVWSSVVIYPIGDIIPTLTSSKDTE